MRVYKNAIWITFVMTVLALIGALIFNYCISAGDFWCNVLLGVFGSSLLTLITSVIGYRVERRKTFEGFSYETKAIMHDLNKYQKNWSLAEKIDFFLNYHDISKISWDRYLGDFAFLFDFNKQTSQYIYSEVYQPVLKINQLINYHAWHFRWQKDGSGKNDKVLGSFVQEIEDLIIENTEIEMPTDAGNTVQMSSTKNKIVSTILYELNNKYYKLMYGKRIYDSMEPQTSK